MNESICIIDWAGDHTSGGYWCDYCPDTNNVVFGGEWDDVPDLIIDHEPTEEECRDHVIKNSIN